MSVTKYVGEEALQELVTKMKAYTDNKEITLDDSVTQNSSNGVKSSGIYTALTTKQDTIDSSHKLSSDLVSDTNNTNKFVTTSEKNTWNAKQNALTFDSAPTNSSTNPVTSGGVYTALSGKQDVLTFDTTPTSSSTNPVTSGGVYTSVNGLDTRLTTIEGKIPSAATSSNQLADKAFVNSSIATATATFKGTYSIVDDLNLAVTASQASVATALGTKISGEDDNDYAFVTIPVGEPSGTNGTFSGIGSYGGNPFIMTIVISSGAMTSITGTDFFTGATITPTAGDMWDLSSWTQTTYGGYPYFYRPSGNDEQMVIAWNNTDKMWVVTDDNYPFVYLKRPIKQVDRYKYNGTAWVYEYTLNTSGYTSAQWAAINSGITSSLVTQIGTNQSSITSLQSSKQDVIDSSHKLSADLISDGTTNKTVTATEKSTWSAKQDAMTAITTAEVDALFS